MVKSFWSDYFTFSASETYDLLNICLLMMWIPTSSFAQPYSSFRISVMERDPVSLESFAAFKFAVCMEILSLFWVCFFI